MDVGDTYNYQVSCGTLSTPADFVQKTTQLVGQRATTKLGTEKRLTFANNSLKHALQCVHFEGQSIHNICEWSVLFERT